MSHPLKIAEHEWPDAMAAARLTQLLDVALRHQFIIVRHHPKQGVNVELNRIFADEVIKRGRDRHVRCACEVRDPSESAKTRRKKRRLPSSRT